MNQPSPGDVFSSPRMSNESDLRPPSPHNNLQQPPDMPQGAPPPQPGNTPGGPGASNGRVMLPASDLQARLTVMRPILLQQEATIQNLNQRLNAIRGTNPPEEAKILERIKEASA
ncbi:unnamed protein product [Cyclocybe aegerita]|uniref:Uncharacterized protein n=1 Tax=Cyclocybe aegerita TaxID=1973307 RepID=A0A8S0WBA8_CYCAE|nr:unnamed protein product [Cyclocybe aegerita]